MRDFGLSLGIAMLVVAGLMFIFPIYALLWEASPYACTIAALVGGGCLLIGVCDGKELT
jgi:hypothetical protein